MATMRSTRRPKTEKEGLGRTASVDSIKSNQDESNANRLGKTILKPADQEQLTEAELNEEFTRILNANNPRAAQNISRYNFKEKAYKTIPNAEHHVLHFENDGYFILNEEGKFDGIIGGQTLTTVVSNSQIPKIDSSEKKSAPNNEEVDENGEAVVEVKKATTKNQFNYSDRAAQSINHPFKDRSTNTEPPPQKTFSASVTQWEIYDSYIEDEIAKEKIAKEKAKAVGGEKVKGAKEESKINTLPTEAHNEDVMSRQELAKSFRILERMANQNTYEDVAQDYKYWEDASDEFREGKGTLLPLWTFNCEVDKRKQVTAVAWNYQYKDFFAVGYGSYDFMRQGPGMIACFSLKNPSHPEFIYQTDSGVMSLDFHKQDPSMIVAGFYDGSVCVFDLKRKSSNAIYQSDSREGKHTEPVWQVMWGPEDLDGNTNFYSVSSDGRVTQWTLVKNELLYTDIIKLDLVSGLQEDQDELFGFASASCISFCPNIDHLFVVGTEEGKIHKCSKTYHNEYLASFEGHNMNVYALKYNPFSSRCFLSASADWTVKLWDHDSSKAALTFDLSSSVGDVCWSPYSSTVFAACTADGKVFVFDLNENKYEPLCEQQITKKSKLTHLAFNPNEPILLVGDDKGTVTSLKLSPNLRKRRRASDDAPENERIEKIVDIALGLNVNK
ncbi:hypothetical protein O9G_002527 [Rozella allomycis CSF55]|uniref:WD40 repeat-like protein n=1 Tax=Rozella allomycis (strain CSF55) TaxID=988480 RepID=A0A075AUH5_ROZAC|nr:hypothetical protein O9G_002527 [Rozella allomycis CSF55]|eukprot:EPZ33815.1 hypothetical protein O9G_002527 [Rozella allomycis CSF55]